MEKYFTEKQVMEFVSKYLRVYLGYPADLEIKRYILDNEGVEFDLCYIAEFKGKQHKVIAPLSRKNFICLLKQAMQSLGYDEFFINIRVVEEQVVYSLSPILKGNYKPENCKRKSKKRR